MRACEPCQDREVAALSSSSYVFGISWASQYKSHVENQSLPDKSSGGSSGYKTEGEAGSCCPGKSHRFYVANEEKCIWH